MALDPWTLNPPYMCVSHSVVSESLRPHGQKSLVGYSPWGRKESGTSEQVDSSNAVIGAYSLWEICVVQKTGKDVNIQQLG